jgi:hypothetical protein
MDFTYIESDFDICFRTHVIGNRQDIQYALQKVSCHTVDNSNAVLDLVCDHAP